MRKMDQLVLETRILLNPRPFDFSREGDGSETYLLHDLMVKELNNLGFIEGDEFFILMPGRNDPGYGEVMLICLNLMVAHAAIGLLKSWQPKALA